MDRDAFWTVVDDAAASSNGMYATVDRVRETLQAMPPEEIIAFARIQQELMAESYRWDLWGLAFVIHGGASDDAFEFFRAGLMSQGRGRWELTLDNPVRASEIMAVEDVDDLELEEFLSVAAEAYESATGEAMPDDALAVRYPPQPLGEPLDEEAMWAMYPAYDA